MRHALFWMTCVLVGAPPLWAQAHHDEHAHADEHSHRGPGPHFVDVFYTENAFLERKVRPDLSYAATEDATLYTFTVEVEWALRPDWAFIVHAPLHRLSEPAGTAVGIGDIAVGAKYALVNDRRRFILAAGADVALPTGDAGRGLGEEAASAAPFLLAWFPFGTEQRATFQAALHVDLPLSDAGHAHGEASAAVTYTLRSGVSPLLELMLDVPLEGGEDMTWSAAPGVRWELAPGWEIGAGVRLRLAGPEHEDYRIVAGAIRHFSLPR